MSRQGRASHLLRRLEWMSWWVGGSMVGVYLSRGRRINALTQSPMRLFSAKLPTKYAHNSLTRGCEFEMIPVW